MTLLAGFRRFYLYAALSVAVLGVAAALGAVLALNFRFLDLGPRPGADEIRGTFSFALAVLLFALPIGAVHLWLIARSLRDPVEASAGVRHFFLNGWIVFALLIALAAAVALANALILKQGVSPSPDTGGPLAALVVSFLVAVIAWRWRASTHPASVEWETVFAFILMTIAMVVAASNLASAARLGGDLLSPEETFPLGGPFAPSREAVLVAVITVLLSLITWAIGVVWQWHRRAERLRTVYLVVAYAIGVILVAIGLVQQLVAIDALARARATMAEVTGPWPQLAAGAILVVLHLAGLFFDRGRNGHPAAVADRWIRGVPALIALGVLLAGVVSWWTYVVDHILFTAFATDDPRDHAAFAGAATVVGGVLYAASWPLFLASTRNAPASAVRRLYLFTVICLALIATVVAGAVTAFNVLSLVLGAPNASELGRTAVSWSFPAVVAAMVFGTHLFMLIRDNRAARRAAPATPEAPPDPLLALLEDVARGRVGVAEAAARIRSAPGEPAQ